ncbi:hypothetical protein BCR44DRAFT_1423330 [Catenaria anguillulae PL171]|uniref:Uncharacterized protein n=1 Tax=Catenaria anguillulae PL171 TaxID=765915 RepID=A0A1Y2I496_9FUNG|nr:hypothetical protein BCR44DRAFT_1423330 [Catenaria anguillulae PL171]
MYLRIWSCGGQLWCLSGSSSRTQMTRRPGTVVVLAFSVAQYHVHATSRACRGCCLTGLFIHDHSQQSSECPRPPPRGRLVEMAEDIHLALAFTLASKYQDCVLDWSLPGRARRRPHTQVLVNGAQLGVRAWRRQCA